MNTRPARIAGLVSLVVGVLFILTGMSTWGLITSQLSAERITVPADAPFAQGSAVQGPLSAYAQAETINKHALAGSDGKTYAELGAEARKATEAGDTALAEELTKQRTTVMNGSFLRASLFTSILAYGVSLMAIGVGFVLALIGWALMTLHAPRASRVAPADAPAGAFADARV